MKIWRKIFNKLEEQKKVTLLLVCSHKGSSPGKYGFKMMVCEDGTLYGSIGGGVTEFQIVDKVRSLFIQKNKEPFLINQVHREGDKDSSGMVCAGEQLVLVYPFTTNDKVILEKIIKHKSGKLSIKKDGFSLSFNSIVKNDFYFNQDKNGEWFYEENINRKPKIYIVGGGHVGLATSKVFSSLNFEVSIFENRENINTFEENTSADNKTLIDYNLIADYIPKGKNTYIVIMTHGYTFDKLVVSKLLKDDYKYIGLLGSKAKIHKMFNAFKTEGISKYVLENLDAPIGMKINSKTPSEIAISIAAKIIQIKNA